eukprot:scaffold2888_cov60-Phaeocystis_antarctica.AAC.2
MSEPVVKRDIWMISGAIQYGYGVPTTAPTPVVSPSLRATPRSASLTWVSVRRSASVHLALARDEHIGALDVSVADAVRVQVLEPLEDLPRVGRDERLREAAELLDDRGERAVAHELEYDVEVVARAYLHGVEVEVVARPHRLVAPHNPLVLQRVQQLDLRLDRAQPGLGHVLDRDLLDRAELAGLTVEGAVHPPRGAAAQLLPQLVLGVEHSRLR